MQEHYEFRTINGRQTVVTEYNTRILWLSPDDGRVLVWRSLRARARYWWHRKTAPMRHYVRLHRLIAKYS